MFWPFSSTCLPGSCFATTTSSVPGANPNATVGEEDASAPGTYGSPFRFASFRALSSARTSSKSLAMPNHTTSSRPVEPAASAGLEDVAGVVAAAGAEDVLLPMFVHVVPDEEDSGGGATGSMIVPVVPVVPEDSAGSMLIPVVPVVPEDSAGSMIPVVPVGHTGPVTAIPPDEALHAEAGATWSVPVVPGAVVPDEELRANWPVVPGEELPANWPVVPDEELRAHW